MTVREIAEAWHRDTRRSYLTVEWSDAIATLLNAVVEERARIICEVNNGDWTAKKVKNLCRRGAIKSLKLEGVWPVKEG